MNGKVGTFYGPDVKATVVKMGTPMCPVVLKGLTRSFQGCTVSDNICASMLAGLFKSFPFSDAEFLSCFNFFQLFCCSP